MSLQVYVGGDMLLKGSQLLREQEKARIKELGFIPYAPQDDKEINDKANQTAETNSKLSAKIFEKDTRAMVESDILIFEVANNNVGTCVEIGQWAMIHWLSQENPSNILLRSLASKPIFFHSTDIRDTSIPETGYERSHSYNQYLIGAVEKAFPLGIQTWEEIEQELLKLNEVQVKMNNSTCNPMI